ncbi:hypothetical protein V5O48_013274 [Marasmius crinis-equi]|uniref:Uncharacterized protein n=1 Tax=Marasmius crinis-equi TaxID=585013 RepID=A0ABR3F0I4_9AGAR
MFRCIVKKTYIVKNKNHLPKGTFQLKLHDRTVEIGGSKRHGAECSLLGSQKYIVPMNADILFVPKGSYMDDEEDQSVKIGRIDASIILTDLLCNNGRKNDFQLICAARSNEMTLAQLAGDLFNEFGEHRNMAGLKGDEEQGDKLIIQGIYLEPQWRGFIVVLTHNTFNLAKKDSQVTVSACSPWSDLSKRFLRFSRI